MAVVVREKDTVQTTFASTTVGWFVDLTDVTQRGAFCTQI
jgi:hypothetical protein